MSQPDSPRALPARPRTPRALPARRPRLSSLVQGTAIVLSVVMPISVACGSREEGPGASDDFVSTGGASSGDGASSSGARPSGDDGDDFVDLGGQPASTGGGPAVQIIETLPSGFSAVEGALDGSEDELLRGGWRLVGPLADLDDDEVPACANILRVLVRDFLTYEHPDFGGLPPAPFDGLVADELDENRKPVATNDRPLVAEALDDWYRNVEGTNVPYVVDLWLEPEGDQFVFDTSRFFPIDSVGSDEMQLDFDDTPRNFGFTTELHTSFEYKGGETFTFRGDDDVFVFVDHELVLDLGGVHGPVSGSIAIDSLELVAGRVYDLDLFHAERNPWGSNFRLETTLDFTECGVILPVDEIY